MGGSRRSGRSGAQGSSIRLKGSGGGSAGSLPSERVGAPQVKSLGLRDLGGTHITYLACVCISVLCWLGGTNTEEGRKFIVPFLSGRRKKQLEETSEARSRPALHQGLLNKEGKFGGRRHLRFFVLEDHALKYYKDMRTYQHHPLGFIGEFACYGLVAHVDKNCAQDGAGAEFGFIIEGDHDHHHGDVSHRKMKVACKTADEREAWIEAIGVASNKSVHQKQ